MMLVTYVYKGMLIIDSRICNYLTKTKSSSANSSLCLSIFLKNNVNARHAITLTESGVPYLTQLRQDTASCGNSPLYFIEIISVNLVKQYKDWPFNS